MLDKDSHLYLKSRIRSLRREIIKCVVKLAVMPKHPSASLWCNNLQVLVSEVLLLTTSEDRDLHHIEDLLILGFVRNCFAYGIVEPEVLSLGDETLTLIVVGRMPALLDTVLNRRVTEFSPSLFGLNINFPKL